MGTILAGGMIRWPAEYYPDKTAIKFEGHELTFRQVNERINRLANGLIGLGMKRGDRVAALLYNSPRAVETRFALMKAGLCMVPINIRQSEEENTYIINHSVGSVVILDDEYLPQWERMKGQCPAVHTAIVAGENIAPGLSYEEVINSAYMTINDGVWRNVVNILSGMGAVNYVILYKNFSPEPEDDKHSSNEFADAVIGHTEP